MAKLKIKMILHFLIHVISSCSKVSFIFKAVYLIDH